MTIAGHEAHGGGVVGDGAAPGGPLRSAVIVNPVRVEDLPARRRIIEAALQAAEWPLPAWFETTTDDTGTGQARRAVEEGAAVVFVCGGDGTVRSVIAGLVGTGAALAVLPAGTGNLLAANLGLPDDPAEGVRLAVRGGRRQVDVGQVDGEVFAVMAGMGFDAAIMDDASARLKARFGTPAYVLSAVRHLRDRPMRVRIRIDENPPRTRRAVAVLVGNVGRLSGGIRLLPHAEPDNGQMEVAILAPRHLAHWAALAWAVLLRRDRVPRMEVLRGSRISIVSDRMQPRELDGDVIDAGCTLTVTVRPGALRLCVAEPARSPDLAEGTRA
jgi:YegS/Rv2252/BmrU family lipid kinase